MGGGERRVRRAEEDDAERSPATGHRRGGGRRLLTAAGVDPSARAETLSLEEFARIAEGAIQAPDMTALAMSAHAKLNVFLRVLGRREDGYHDIETLLLPISLADDVTVEPADELTLSLEGPAAERVRVDDENLAIRAARALAAEVAKAGAGNHRARTSRSRSASPSPPVSAAVRPTPPRPVAAR